MDLLPYIIAILGGALAGVINTLAGNGSAITLTILTEVLHLPPTVANGTNRLGVFFQTTVASWEFHRKGKLDLPRSWRYILPTFLGAVAGGVAAILVSNELFLDVFRFLLLFMLIVILVKPRRWLRPSDTDHRAPLWLAWPVFLFLGFYGGFIQMGMGIFFLAAMVLVARFNIIEANAVKLFVVGLYTVLLLALFQWRGLIDWKIGLIMAIGQTAGSWATAVFATRYEKADVWAYRLLVLVVIIALGKLFNLHRLLF